MLLVAGHARAQPLRDERAPETNAANRPADTHRPNPAPTTTLSDQWPLGRNWLRARGVDIAAGYVSEAAANVAGGERQRGRETGKFALGATLDMDKLVGLRGGKVQATATSGAAKISAPRRISVSSSRSRRSMDAGKRCASRSSGTSRASTESTSTSSSDA